MRDGSDEKTRKRRKKLLDDLKDRRGYSHLMEEALDRIMWRNRFVGGFGPVVRQNTERMNESTYPTPPYQLPENYYLFKTSLKTSYNL